MTRPLLMVLLLVSVAHRAEAQVATPAEVSVAFSAVRDTKNDVNLPQGWNVGAAMALVHDISVVAEVGNNSRRIPLLGPDGQDYLARISVTSFLAGPRLTARLGRAKEFGQVLVGYVSSAGSAFGVTDTQGHFAIQPGAGLDFGFARRFALRFELDVRLLRRDANGNETGAQFRGTSGLVYALRR
ncbi:MAG: hypothetical protein HY047_00690 [Acidobacteria bacterium]|nr:hypothetical protein [Acidobacteriota bacterium]